MTQASQIVNLSEPEQQARAQRIATLRGQAQKDSNAEPDENMMVDATMSGNELMTAVMRERYAMPTSVVAALRQTGKLLTLKMLNLVNSDKFDKLPVAVQLQVFNAVMDRAFGKGDSALAALSLQEKLGALDSTSANGGNAAKQLEAIESRMEFPELRSRKSAKEVAQEKRDSNGSEVLTFSPRTA